MNSLAEPPNPQRVSIGVDIGSTTVKTVALAEHGDLLAWDYRRSHGRPRSALLRSIDQIASALHLDRNKLVACTTSIGFTGSGGRPVAELLGGHAVNELVSQTRAVGEYYPAAHTVIEIGGQDSKLLSLEWDKTLEKMILVDMSLNNLCAAGTGAFLDQQAERLGIAIEGEFADIALQSKNPARIAGRCTVFAKSDMIHLQQKGTPLADILAGLSMALARNFKSVIGKGRSFRAPILFQGGVAYNQAVVRAFVDVLRLQPDELIVPRRHQLMAALGCALVAAEQLAMPRRFDGFQRLGQPSPRTEAEADRSRLSSVHAGFATRAPSIRNLNGQRPSPPLGVYLGIDVGSLTTKVALIDDEGAVVARRYLPTRGAPLDAVKHALAEIGAECGDRVAVHGAGVTGSARHLTAEFVGADVVRSEITAQARAAVALDPRVDTILEIGGQDSKYIRLADGVVVDFTMNSACAAGTGSFLEEQAVRLQVPIEEEFSRRALGAACPAALGERCTVFMESDLVHHQQQGARVEDLAAGLAYAIAENYLNRVVARREIGDRVFFQGGVGWNDSVVAAFQQILGRPITVPPHHDVTGAIGAAHCARDWQRASSRAGSPAETLFVGFHLQDREHSSRSFVCRACPNLCEINRVLIADKPPLFYGARCDRFERRIRRQISASQKSRPDLFTERERLLMGDYRPPNERRSGRTRIGMPRVLTFHDLFPYWRAFFEELEMEIVLSAPTNPTTAAGTKEHAVAEVCYPAKLVYGHVCELLKKDIDLIFLPTLMNRENVAPGQAENTYCLYIRAAGNLIGAAPTLDLGDVKLVTTPLHFQWERLKKEELQALAGELAVTGRHIERADAAGQAAQRRFYADLRRRGREALSNLDGPEPALVLVGRPYNTADPGVSQHLPGQLSDLGALPIPQDFLPLEKIDLSARFPRMFWRSGQDILAAGEIIRRDDRLHAVYVTNFSCGPDSFILSYFRRIMGAKPFLELELDDHSGEAGIVTRCEAFLESLQSMPAKRASHAGSI